MRFPAAEAVRGVADLGERLRALVAGDDRAGRFLWPLFRDLFLYSAQMVPEISDRIVEIDRAMRWGFAFELGPFELWDALGVEPTVERMRREGCAVPRTGRAHAGSGAQVVLSRRRTAKGSRGTRYFDIQRGAWQELEPRPGVLVLGDLKRARGVVKKNAGASLVDLGDGVLCLEFHSKLNILGDDAGQMMRAALEETSRGFGALVIANQGEHFSAGADLCGRPAGRAGVRSGTSWTPPSAVSSRPIWRSNTRPSRWWPRPSAWRSAAAAKWCCTAARVQASAETYMGLVETGRGPDSRPAAAARKCCSAWEMPRRRST